MKTNYTIEEWTALGLLEDVPVHRIEQVVHALNYCLAWIERNNFADENVLILPMVAMTIVTIVDVSDLELEKILSDAYVKYCDHMITYVRYHSHMNEIEADNEFSQEFCEKTIKKYKNRLQLN